jgi:hypothetical protein
MNGRPLAGLGATQTSPRRLRSPEEGARSWATGQMAAGCDEDGAALTAACYALLLARFVSLLPQPARRLLGECVQLAWPVSLLGRSGRLNCGSTMSDRRYVGSFRDSPFRRSISRIGIFYLKCQRRIMLNNAIRSLLGLSTKARGAQNMGHSRWHSTALVTA